MNTLASTLSPSPRLIPLLVAAMASLTIGAIAGTFSLTGTVLGTIVIGLFAMTVIGVKYGNLATSAVAQLMVSVGIICVPLGAIVTTLAR